MSVNGRTILVTGPARGIGAATARELSRRGARLALVGLEPELLAALAGELGPQADWHEADVTDLAAMEKAAAWAAERFGGIDGLVTNAGIGTPCSVAQGDPADFERVVEVNLMGTWRSVRAVLPHLRASRGYVLCIASAAAAVHLPMMAAYAASKAGVEAFAHALRLEEAEHGVDVGIAYLSWVDTDMVRDAFARVETESWGENLPSWALRRMTVEAIAEALADAVERRTTRLIRPREVAPAILANGLVEPLVRSLVLRRRPPAPAAGRPVARH